MGNFYLLRNYARVGAAWANLAPGGWGGGA